VVGAAVGAGGLLGLPSSPWVGAPPPPGEGAPPPPLQGVTLEGRWR